MTYSHEFSCSSVNSTAVAIPRGSAGLATWLLAATLMATGGVDIPVDNTKNMGQIKAQC